MAHTDLPVHELVTKIEKGQIRLPEMQRRYVWSKARVRDLLDSLYHRYPSGNILTWDHQPDPDLDPVKTQAFAVEQESNEGRFQLLLDGQQRLTSLMAVLRGEPVTVKGLKRPIEILFNMEHPERTEIVTEVQSDSSEDEDGDDSDSTNPHAATPEEGHFADSEEDEDTVDATDDEMMLRFEQMVFVVENQRLKDKSHWVRVSDIFKADDVSDILVNLGYKDLSDPKTKKYSERLKRVRDIKNYTYRVDELSSDLSYQEVTEIFVRVNSLGVKLRSSDLALAQITAKWTGSLEEFGRYQEQCAVDRHFDFDLGVHVRNLVVFASGQSRFSSVKNLSKTDLEEGWRLATESMSFALDVLGNNFSFESSSLLSSPFIAIAVAQFVHQNKLQLSPTEERLLRKWVLLANAKGRYARGSSESILDEDLRAIRENKGEECLNALLELLERQVGRLEITPRDLEGRNRRSSLFKAMFLLFHSRGATDWHDRLQISTTSKGKQALQFHHIFPKKVLDGRYSTHEINDICNLAFISGKTNRRIASDEPSDYLPKIVEDQGQDVLDRQCVPADRSLWSVSAYQGFLTERRALVAKELNEFIAADSWRNG